MTPRLSVQLYSVRAALSDDFDKTLAALAGYGYRQVEPFAIDAMAEQLTASLPEHGLSAPTAHAGLLDGDRDAILTAGRALGVERVIQPISEAALWSDAAAVSRLARRLNGLVDEVADAGLALGYHNHAFELASTFDGRHALELFADELDPRIGLEVDTYWAHVGGADVPALLQQLGERVVAIHLKDGDGSADTSRQTAVGSGDLPVLDYLDAAVAIDFGVVELDDTSGDMLACIRDSHSFLTREREWA